MAEHTQEVLLQKLRDHTARVAILGLGYVGLPLAVVFAEAGFEVTGIDPDNRKVETVQAGGSHIQDVPAENIKRLVDAGKLSATTDFA
jgi:UDP-N-acetyl-D-glucosamine dehydrogenase